jgi:ADP-heptose:LPS heptosyltransferase
VQPLALLTGCWLAEVFGLAQNEPGGSGYRPECPYVALPSEDMRRGTALKARARSRLAAVNLGVGGNGEKRVEDPFEVELLVALIEAGYKLVFDRGAGDEEVKRTGHLIELLQTRGKTIHAVPTTGPEVPQADVFVWDGSLSGFGGLIASSALYCGYDSAGGHLAAALGVPVIDIFTDTAPPRMRERWTPWGQAPVRVITAPRSAPQEALRQFHTALREHAR